MTLNIESMNRQTKVKILTAELMKAQAIAEHFEFQLAALDKPEAETKGQDVKTPDTEAPKVETKKSGKPSPTTKKTAKSVAVVEPENEVDDVIEASEEEIHEVEAVESDDTESEESSEISDDEIRKLLIEYAKRKNDPTAAAKTVAKYKVQKSKQLNQRQRAEIKHMVEGFQ